MSNYLFDKAILSTTPEMARYYYPEKKLDFYKDDKIVKSFIGRHYQFEVTAEFIAFYDSDRGGQDMPRHKGDLLFKVSQSDVGFFEEIKL